MIAPILVFAYGNPSRGDDALGPAIFDLLSKTDLTNVDLLTDFQLQVEHAIDLEKRKGVLFIDASVSCPDPYEFHQVKPERDDSYTTHAMSPASVLAVYKNINKSEPPPSYLLAIRGYDFELGNNISNMANKNLQQAFIFTQSLLETDTQFWAEKQTGIQ